MRALVTGATGLLGSHLVDRLLATGHFVAVLVRDHDPQSELIRTGRIAGTAVVNGALEDYAALERALVEHEVDTVFHLGAQTIVGTALRSPLATFEANVRGTYHLLEACRVQSGLVRRVLIASSDKAYGDSPVLPYTEDMPLLARYPYDVSKACGDLIAQSYAQTYALPVVIARCGNLYGGGDLNWSRIVPGTIRSLLLGERPILRSDGTFRRDYVYVQDAVDAYLAMAEAAARPEIAGQVFNFGPEHPVSVLEIVNQLRRLLDREDLEPDIRNQAAAEIRDQYLDSTCAREVLGWAPKYSLEAGLRETIPWYRQALGIGPS